MANQQKYFIGPSLLSDIRSTIQRVDAIAPRTSGPAQEVRLQMLQQPMDGGGRLRIGKYTGSSGWPIGTCATVTIWSRTESGCSPSASSPTETVEAVANLSHNVPADSWVAIGQGTDGHWYLVDSGIQGTCRQTIGGEDVTHLPGWSASTKQTLSQEDGCLKWTNAVTSSSGSCRKPQIYDYDLTTLAGYSASKKQALVHDNGCLKWMDIEECP